MTPSASLRFWICVKPAASCGLKSIPGSRLPPPARHCKRWAAASKGAGRFGMSEPQPRGAQSLLPRRLRSQDLAGADRLIAEENSPSLSPALLQEAKVTGQHAPFLLDQRFNVHNGCKLVNSSLASVCFSSPLQDLKHNVTVNRSGSCFSS